MLSRPCQPQLHKFFDFFNCHNPVDIKHLWLAFRYRKQKPLPGGIIVQNRL